MIDDNYDGECYSVGGRRTDREIAELYENMHQCHFIYHEPHMT
jgi:hypothetical protein